MTPTPHLLILALPVPPRSLEPLGLATSQRKVTTPFGEVGPFGLRQSQSHPDIWILPYFGGPDRTDPRATLWAAKELGIQRILAWEGMVALAGSLQRGDMVVPQDYIDWTKHQPTTFFAQTGAGYIQQNPAFCPDMRHSISKHFPSAKEVIYLGAEGPRRETAAEAAMYQKWGAHVLGFNLVPEAYLAKELEMCFAAIGLITSLAANRPRPTAGGEVRMMDQMILNVLPHIFQELPDSPNCGCDHVQSGLRQRGVLADDWREWG